MNECLSFRSRLVAFKFRWRRDIPPCQRDCECRPLSVLAFVQIYEQSVTGRMVSNASKPESDTAEQTTTIPLFALSNSPASFDRLHNVLRRGMCKCVLDSRMATLMKTRCHSILHRHCDPQQQPTLSRQAVRATGNGDDRTGSHGDCPVHGSCPSA